MHNNSLACKDGCDHVAICRAQILDLMRSQAYCYTFVANDEVMAVHCQELASGSWPFPDPLQLNNPSVSFIFDTGAPVLLQTFNS